MSVESAAALVSTIAAPPPLEHHTPRQYQTELYLEARKRNVIAYLDTGSGKTLVSVLLIKDKAGGLNVDGCKRVTVFLAPKVLLVQQQADVLRKHTSLRVSQYCGEMNVDYWDRRRWAKELKEQDVWVMTPQILLNILRHGFIKINDMNLLVCDECHRAVKRDPYNCIMQEFYHDKSNTGSRPHIFGMTASPVNTRAKQTQSKVSEAVWQLERNMDAQVITVIDRNQVTAAAPLPELKLLYYAREHESDALKKAQAGMAAAIWSLHRGESVMAQLAAARSRQAAEAACIGLQLDEEKLTSISATMRRHLQGLAMALQDLGPWVATAVLNEILKPKQANNLLYHFSDIGADMKDTSGEPFADSIRKTPGAYIQPSKVVRALDTLTDNTKGTTLRSSTEDIEMTEVAAVKAPAPMSPEVQAMNAGLKEVANMLLNALPTTSQRRVKIEQGLAMLDPASPSFKAQMRRIVSDTLGSIPGKLLDLELGIVEATPQADVKAAGYDDEWNFDDGEAGRLRLPLFTSKVMAFAQYLLQYKGEVTASKLASYGSFEEAAKHHWSAILFVTRKMTSLGLDALFRAAPCLKPWRAAVLMGYGGSLGPSPLTNKAQHHILKQMKAGELDIVISTAVAEEGLDVKQCQLVFRFDLPSTLLAFVQSRSALSLTNTAL